MTPGIRSASCTSTICCAPASSSARFSLSGVPMFSKPRADLVANSYDFEMGPLVKATGFREYDARWLLGPEINLLGLQALGLGLGTYIHELGQSRIVVGHDFREYSLSVKQALSL